METQFSNLGKVLNEQCMKMYNESRKELETYKNACKDNEALIDELKQENADLEDSLTEATNRIKDMQNEIYETRSWRDSWKNAYTDRGNWIERLLDQKDELNKEIEDLKTQIAFKKYENEPTDEEIFAILERRGYYGNLVKQTEIQIGA